MSDRAHAALLTVVRLAVFAVLVAGVVVAQRTVGWGHLGVMLLCLSGLLVMLWRYNRTYT
jgi:hypothetical protein